MEKISTCLWFDRQAEEAANFYVSVFPNSKIVNITRYLDGAQMPKGTVLTVQFILDGREFIALNGGPHFTFSPAISFMVNCDAQTEVDRFWARLIADGGEAGRCGWLTDKYGLSWQIVPNTLLAMLSSGDEAASQRAFAAMMQMTKLDIAALERAYRNS